MVKGRPAGGWGKYSDTTIAIGGLMRCCIKTIEDFVREHADESWDTETEVADVLDCEYEAPDNQQIILDHEGVWRWNHI